MTVINRYKPTTCCVLANTTVNYPMGIYASDSYNMCRKMEHENNRKVNKWNEVRNDRAVAPVIGAVMMVMITVILAAVMGTFVLGLGEAAGTSANAGVSVEQEPGESVTIEMVDTGNLDSLRVVGPDGSRSGTFSSDGILRTGTEIEIRNGGFAPSDVEPAVEPDGSAMNLVNGDLKDGEGPKYDVPGDKKNQLDAGSGPFGFDYPNGVTAANEECRVQAPGVVRGIDINGRNDGSTTKRPEIGCSLQHLTAYLSDYENYGGFGGPSASGLSGDAPIVDGASFDEKIEELAEVSGGRITYTEGEYSIIGTVDGNEQVIRTFTVEGE